jgi:hypothetical protein
MASIAATFSRHVIVRAHSTTVDSSFADAQEIASSQIEFVLQSNRAGVPVDSSKILNALQSEAEHHSASLGVADLADNSLRVGLQALAPDGMGVTRLLEVERVATPRNLDPATLPRLTEATRAAFVADGSIPRFDYTTSTTVSNTVLNGVVVIGSGVELTLENVIVNGAIVSERTLDPDAFGEFDSGTAPELIINGNIRLLAGTDLPGVAIVMPDGVVSTSNPDARAQIVGDVVTHDFTLGCPGSMQGHLAVVGDPVLHVTFEHIGANRGPVDWSPILDTHGVFEPVSVAYVPRPLSVDDFTDLTATTLPPVN